MSHSSDSEMRPVKRARDGDAAGDPTAPGSKKLKENPSGASGFNAVNNRDWVLVSSVPKLPPGVTLESAASTFYEKHLGPNAPKTQIPRGWNAPKTEIPHGWNAPETEIPHGSDAPETEIPHGYSSDPDMHDDAEAWVDDMIADQQLTYPKLPEIKDPELLRLAFTHSSYDDQKNYEQLEWFGDAVLEIIATKVLLKRYPNTKTGVLTQYREDMVKNVTLAEFAKGYEFGKRMKHHWSKENMSGDKWTKVMGDLMEAYIGAVATDDPVNGEKRLMKWLTALWEVDYLPKEQPQVDVDNAKVELAKLLLGKQAFLDYRQEKPMDYSTPARQRYTMGVYLTGWGFKNEKLGEGKGQNKRMAGCMAAKDAMNSMSRVLIRAHREKIKYDRRVQVQREAEAARAAANGEEVAPEMSEEQIKERKRELKRAAAKWKKANRDELRAERQWR